jgi:hypothetical protein
MNQEIEQVFELRVSTNFANEVSTRQLDQYGSAFVKIAERYDQGQRKPYAMKFTAEEVEQLKSECEWVASRGCDWYPEEKACYRGLLRQIRRVQEKF